MINVVVCKERQEIAERGADRLVSVIGEHDTPVLGLATGSSPIGMYEELIRRYEKGEVDFSRVITFNLDEYYPISPDNDQSYRYFMNRHLFDHVNIQMANTHVLDGLSTDVEKECRAFERQIEEAGGVDIQVLGIGRNGHIGFNEPAPSLVPGVHKTDLTESTIRANARFFASESDVPRQSLTMGMANILRAREILVIAYGEDKADAVAALLSGGVTTACPVTFLNLHDRVTLLCDRAALTLCGEGVPQTES